MAFWISMRITEDTIKMEEKGNELFGLDSIASE